MLFNNYMKLKGEAIRGFGLCHQHATYTQVSLTIPLEEDSGNPELVTGGLEEIMVR